MFHFTHLGVRPQLQRPFCPSSGHIDPDIKLFMTPTAEVMTTPLPFCTATASVHLLSFSDLNCSPSISVSAPGALPTAPPSKPCQATLIPSHSHTRVHAKPCITGLCYNHALPCVQLPICLMGPLHKRPWKDCIPVHGCEHFNPWDTFFPPLSFPFHLTTSYRPSKTQLKHKFLHEAPSVCRLPHTYILIGLNLGFILLLHFFTVSQVTYLQVYPPY